MSECKTVFVQYKVTHQDCKRDRKVLLKETKGLASLLKCLYFWLMAI